MLYWKKADVSTAIILQSLSCRTYTAVFCACCVCSDEEQSKRQLFSNRAFGWKKGYIYFVSMNNRTSLREQLYCIHPQHTHSPCTSTCTTHPPIPSQLPSTTLQCTQLTNTKHSWQNGTRCRDGVNVLWCRSHLVWLVFEGSMPTCAGFHSENFFVTFLLHNVTAIHSACSDSNGVSLLHLACVSGHLHTSCQVPYRGAKMFM